MKGFSSLGRGKQPAPVCWRVRIRSAVVVVKTQRGGKVPAPEGKQPGPCSARRAAGQATALCFPPKPSLDGYSTCRSGVPAEVTSVVPRSVFHPALVLALYLCHALKLRQMHFFVIFCESGTTWERAPGPAEDAVAFLPFQYNLIF